MDVKELLSLAAIAFGFVSAAPYVRSIIRKETKPHMFSWLIWGIVCGIGSAVQVAEDGGAGSWYFAVNSVYCLGIATASIWIGTRDIKRSDWVVLLIALSAIPLWVMTRNPLWSLFIVIGIDGFAYVPTIRKSWNKPYEENAMSWGLSVITFSLSVAALEAYKVTTYLYPMVFIVVNTGLVALLLLRRQVIDARTQRSV